MKLNVIKKSMICALTLSFSFLLASCSFKKENNNSETTNSTNVFTKKDILAYAKKYNNTNAPKKELKLEKVDTSKYSVSNTGIDYGYYMDDTTGTWYLYSRVTGKTYTINVDEGEYVTTISETGNYDENGYYEAQYGYFIIIFNTGKQMLIDYEGNVVIEKDVISGIQVNAVSDRLIKDIPYLYNGDVTFYDIITVRKGTDNEYLRFKIDAKFVDGNVSTFTRTKLTSEDETDYTDYSPYINADITYLEDYDFYFAKSAYYVKDLKGNVVSTGTLAIDVNSTKYFALDDKLFLQTKTNVTANNDYTYEVNGTYYKLLTYSINLKTGEKKELTDYNYLIIDTIPVMGYNEKNDRNYYAAYYARANKIVDKQVSLTTETFMIDGSGKMLSNKVGEVGYGISYIKDDKYIVGDNATSAIVTSKGKIIRSFYKSNDIYIDYENEVVFVYGGSYTYNGLFVDFDGKLIDYQGSGYAITHTSNGRIAGNGQNVFVNKGNITYLMNTKDGKINIIDSYDYSSNTVSRKTSYGVGTKCVMFNDYLISNNLYIVQIKKSDTEYTFEIHSLDGTLLDTVENVTNINSNSNSNNAFNLTISSSTESYSYAVNYIN